MEFDKSGYCMEAGSNKVAVWNIPALGCSSKACNILLELDRVAAYCKLASHIPAEECSMSALYSYSHHRGACSTVAWDTALGCCKVAVSHTRVAACNKMACYILAGCNRLASCNLTRAVECNIVASHR